MLGDVGLDGYSVHQNLLCIHRTSYTWILVYTRLFSVHTDSTPTHIQTPGADSTLWPPQGHMGTCLAQAASWGSHGRETWASLSQGCRTLQAGLRAPRDPAEKAQAWQLQVGGPPCMALAGSPPFLGSLAPARMALGRGCMSLCPPILGRVGSGTLALSGTHHHIFLAVKGGTVVPEVPPRGSWSPTMP